MDVLSQGPLEKTIKNSPKAQFQGGLANSILFAWVIFLGLAIWHDAKKSTMPPTYDALAYFEKGRNVWQHLKHKTFINPLNVDPSYRPPGTVLMSFPFGYHDDFRGFYFRSVYIPILCFAIAAYIAGYSASASTLWRWMLSAAAMFLSSMPFFYHFEYTDLYLHTWSVPVYYWGLVDAFLGGVAALAAAACARGMQDVSVKWFTVSFLLASLCIFIKPAGLLVMVIIGTSWFFFVGFQLFIQGRQHRILMKRQLLAGSSILLLIYAATLVICFKSQYLSPLNIAYGKSAVGILRAESAVPLTFKILCTYIFPSLGCLLPLGAAILAILGIVGHKKIRLNQSRRDFYASVSLLLSALTTLVAGAWFWLNQTEVTQVRYFVPFAMMAIVYAVPVSLTVLDHYRTLAGIVIFFWCAQIINLGLLLVHPAPPPAWQRWSGVYLLTNSCRAEVEQAQELLKQSRENKINSRVYVLDSSAPSSAFLSVGYYASLIRPEQPSFSVKFPVDWENRNAIKIHDMVTSDYVLFRPMYDPVIREHILTTPLVSGFNEEKLTFEAALTDSTEQNGIQKISETSVRLVKIVDRIKFFKSLEALQHEHSWPAAFVSLNPKECWSSLEIENALPSKPDLANVAFENTFEIDALRMDRNNGNTNLQLWWKALADHSGEDWKLFIHEVDKDGKLLSTRDIALRGEGQCSQDSPSHSATLSFPTSTNPPAYGIGIGFYRSTPAGLVILHAQSGVRDLENRRVLVAYDLPGSSKH